MSTYTYEGRRASILDWPYVDGKRGSHARVRFEDTGEEVTVPFARLRWAS
jgi:hypothetical protein